MIKGRKEGRTDGRNEGRKERRKDARTHARTDGRTDGRTNERTNEKMKVCFLSSETNGVERRLMDQTGIFLQMIAIIKMFMQTSSCLNKDFNKVVVWSQVRIESRPSGNALKVECAN